MSVLDLGISNEQGKASARRDQGGGDREDVLEAFDGAQGHCAGFAWLGSGEVFGAAGKYIDIRKSNGADDLAQESRLLLIGLDQSEANVGGPDLDGQAGEAGAGADVDEVRGRVARDHTTGGGEESAGGEERFAKVARDDLLRLADGSQVDARIPAEQ